MRGAVHELTDGELVRQALLVQPIKGPPEGRVNRDPAVLVHEAATSAVGQRDRTADETFGGDERELDSEPFNEHDSSSRSRAKHCELSRLHMSRTPSTRSASAGSKAKQRSRPPASNGARKASWSVLLRAPRGYRTAARRRGEAHQKRRSDRDRQVLDETG